MVEPGRSAGAREAKKSPAASASATMKVRKKLMSAGAMPEKERSSSKKEKESRHCREAESPSYRLALKSLFSCRNGAPDSHSSRSKKLAGCSGSASICKLRDSPRVMQRPAPEQEAEPCKRRASVSACNSSSERERERERCAKKPLSEAAKQLSSASSSSSTGGGGGSFRAGMQLRRLSGCYECHMVVDPISGVLRERESSMRATIFPCPAPDCGEIFVSPDSLHLHQSTRHAVCELGPEDTSRNIIEIIFQSSWLKKQSPVCSVERILKVHNTARTLARFEEYRDAVKAKAAAAAHNLFAAAKHPRCTADGNELLRFRCATLACPLGLAGATHLCAAAACDACAIIRHGFRTAAPGSGVRTMATSGRAHDAVEEGGGGERRAMLVCRVIAGRVRRAQEQEAASAWEEQEQEHDSVAGSAGVYSSLEELEVFNPTAILPCFVVVYKA